MHAEDFNDICERTAKLLRDHITAQDTATLAITQAKQKHLDSTRAAEANFEREKRVAIKQLDEAKHSSNEARKLVLNARIRDDQTESTPQNKRPDTSSELGFKRALEESQNAVKSIHQLNRELQQWREEQRKRAMRQRQMIISVVGLVAILVGILALMINDAEQRRIDDIASTEGALTRVAIFNATEVAAVTLTTIADEMIKSTARANEALTSTAVAVITDSAIRVNNTMTAVAVSDFSTATAISARVRELQLDPLIRLSHTSSNAAWNTTEVDFGGFPMVLVPAGCFFLGGQGTHFDSRPVAEVCFDEPFWIDKYEVSNARFGSVGCQEVSPGANQPRNCVNWLEARTHCELRGARLPTEAEWEYAAAGPEGYRYPWGDNLTLVNEGAAIDRNSDKETSEVGSFPKGESWVGALDMSGNVWEWTSSIYRDYPYGADHEDENDESSSRTIRGGAFNSADELLTTNRRGSTSPINRFVWLGFRCVRPF